MVKKILPVAIVIFISIIAVFDLLNYGIPPTHDGEYHIMRFQQFYKVLSDGTIYPRWAPDFNNGFGIPLFNYVYPLPNYIAAIFHVLGFGFIDSLKLNMAAASIVGAIFMYLWAKKYWGETGGVISSAFYTFSPYHFLDIYVRGSVGEVWSLGLAPALFWSYLSFQGSRKKIFFVLSSVFLALLIFAHNILALIFFTFFIFYSLFTISYSSSRKSLSLNTFLICILGFGLSSPFWLPAIFETGFVQGLQVAIPTDHFPKLYKLIYSSWGYGFSGADLAGQMSFQIGIANLIGVLSSIIIFFMSTQRRTLAFFILFFFITLFFITPFSAWFWINIPFANYIQYPWRLLSLVILISSFLAGSIVCDVLFKKRDRAKYMIASIFVILTIILSFRYAKAPFYHKRGDQHYLTRSNFTDGTNSPGDAFNTKWLAGIPKKEKNKIELISGSGKVQINKLRSQSYSFDVLTSQNSKIQINTAYFPGWVAEINGRLTGVKEDKGKIVLRLASGTSNIRVFLDSTPIQKISYICFLASVLFLIFTRSKTTAIIKK